MKPEWRAEALAKATLRNPLPWSLLATDRGRAAAAAAFGEGYSLAGIAAAFGYPGDDQLARIIATFIWQHTQEGRITRPGARRAVHNYQIARARCEAMAQDRARYVHDTHSPAAAA